jgi:hypothetical protein
MTGTSRRVTANKVFKIERQRLPNLLVTVGPASLLCTDEVPGYGDLVGYFCSHLNVTLCHEAMG